MKKNSVICLLMLFCLVACAPYMYGVPQENWNRMSERERIEAMRVHERNEQARQQEAEERAHKRALEEQTRRQIAEDRARHEAREQAHAHHAALAREQREQRERIKAINRGDGAHRESSHERKRPASVVLTAPFISGKTLKWETDAQGGQKGTFLVTSTNGFSFYLDQKNYKNRAAGIVKLKGQIRDGKIVINNSKWNETWIGTLQNNGKVFGKIDNKYFFRISE